MILSKRERNIAIGVGVVLVLVVLQFLIVKPYFDSRNDVQDSVSAAAADLEKANAVILEQAKMRKVWDEMNAGGLKNDAAEAEYQVQNALDQWASESNVVVTVFRSERLAPTAAAASAAAANPAQAAAESKFMKIRFHLTGTGPEATLATLLWRVETTSMPLCIEDVQITPHGKDGQDDLQLQLNVSTLCRLPDSDRSGLGNQRTAASAAD